jgi:hypothetical protein
VTAIRSKLGTSNSGTNPIPVNVPTDGTAPVVGDLMLVVINTTAAAPTITVPSLGSWQQVLAPTAMGSRYMAVYRGVRGADDPSQYVFSQSATGAAQALFVAAAAAWGFAGTYSKGASAVTQTTPGVTTTVANSLALSLQAEATANPEADSDITVASPFVKDLWTIAAASPLNSILLAHREMATPGATGDAVSTWKAGNSTGNRGSIMVVLHPLPDTPIVRFDAKMADGQGGIVDVGLVGWDGSKEIELSKVEFVHSGTLVPDLDRLDRVWWMSHRGGSIDYQECTLRGYLESAIHHADVLEISVAITSDGKILCAHDATADRTSSSVRGQGWRFDQHTWAEVQQLEQDLPNRGDTRFTTDRYYSLDEILDKFAATHSFMVDPKALGTVARRDVLYPRLRQIADYQRRIVGKFYHTGTAIADEFHAIGCKAWGYAYAEAITGVRSDGQPTQEPLLSVTAPKWDYLGMEHSASAAVWAEAIRIAAGRRVIAHIVETVTQADQAVAKGARALQVSGVRAVSTAY